MAIYSSSFVVAGVNAAATVLANFKTAATKRAKLLELICFVEAAPTVAPIFSIERMNAVGTGAITLVGSTPADFSDTAAALTVETGWVTTRPTRLAVPIPMRRATTPVAIGSGFVFDFTNRPLIIPISSGILLVNIPASGAALGLFGGTITWDE